MSRMEFKLVLSNLIAKEIGKKLQVKDLNIIYGIIREIKSIDKVDIKQLAKMIATLISGQNKIMSDYDMKEYLKSIIGKTSETGQSGDTNVMTPTDLINLYDTNKESKIDDPNVIQTELNSIMMKERGDMQLLFNPSSYYKRKMIVLDSINQDDALNGSGKIAWDVIPSRDYLTGCVNTTRECRNVVGIRMLSARWEKIPELYYMDDNIARWTILMEELITQSTVGYENRKYHFMTTIGAKAAVDSTGTYTYYDMTLHNFNNGYYWFRRPITSLNRLTLSFGCPWYVFNIKSNKMTGNAVIGGGNLLNVNFQSGANVTNSNAVLMFGNLTITGFTTTDPIANAALIASVNNNTFTPTYLTPYSIQFNIDLTGITLPNNLRLNIYSTNYRMIFPLEIIYQEDES
jgi:hypothetical protein